MLVSSIFVVNMGIINKETIDCTVVGVCGSVLVLMVIWRSLRSIKVSF